MHTLTAKERVTQVVLSLPEDATYGENMKELAFTQMIDSGLEDVRAGRMISNGEMAERIMTW